MTTATAVPPPAESRIHRHRWLILAVVLMAEVMDLLDGTIMTVAAPTIRADLGGSTATIQWLTAAYTLPFAVLLITGGRLGDLFGRRRMFVLGAVGFTAGSLVSALAQSPEMLLATRAVQGAFGALLIPQGFGAIKEAFRDDLGKAMTAFGPVMGMSAVLGPILAGVLIDADAFGSGWRMIFLINLPVGVAAVAGALRFFPADVRKKDLALDLGGMALVTASALALIYPLVQGRELGWPVWAFGLMGAGVAGLGAFGAWEARQRDAALVPPSLMRNAAYTGGMVTAVGFFAAMVGVMLVVSVFCQLGLGFSPAHTGVTLAPLPLGIAVTAPLSFSLVPRFGRKVIQAGIVLNAAGLVLLAVVVGSEGMGVGAWGMAPGALVAGLGMGLVLSPLFDLILSGVADRDVGSASGVLNAVQQLSSAIGVAVVATAFFAFLDHGDIPSSAVEYTALATTGLLGLALALSFLLPERMRKDLPAA